LRILTWSKNRGYDIVKYARTVPSSQSLRQPEGGCDSHLQSSPEIAASSAILFFTRVFLEEVIQLCNCLKACGPCRYLVLRPYYCWETWLEFRLVPAVSSYLPLSLLKSLSRSKY